MKTTFKFIYITVFLGIISLTTVQAQCSVTIEGTNQEGIVELGSYGGTKVLPTIRTNCDLGEYFTFSSSLPDWITSVTDTGSSINITYLQNPTEDERLWGINVYYQGNMIDFLAIKQQDACITPWYYDQDGDGYGDPNSPGALSCNTDDGNPYGQPAVRNNLDYCDDDPNSICAELNPDADDNVNWVSSITKDINGVVKSSTKSYFNDLGKLVQSQSVDMKTGDTWVSSVLYDSQGRPALSTLSAPSYNNGLFAYDISFIRNSSGTTYSEVDFEQDPENPSAVSEGSMLGHYYSTNNVDPSGVEEEFKGNDYHDVTDYPFSRTIYSELNPGSALKSIGGKQLDLGIETKNYSFSMPASRELSQTGAFNDVIYDDIETIKTVVRDVHGAETVMFTDTDGKTLAAARSGSDVFRNMSIEISHQGFIDIHIPVGITGFTIGGQPGITTEVYDLITEEPITSATGSLANGFYRVSITNLEDYDPENDPITISYKENYYDYSLNEFDEAGRLLASYQPLNKLKSEFQYDALGQLVYSKSPDEGEAWFKYRKDGQIRFSQNSKQLAAGEFSYTDYDALGRPVESGVISGGTFDENLDPDAALPSGAGISRSEQLFTTYDEITQSDETYLSNNLHVDYHDPTFLASNVSKTHNDNTTTYYSYDVYGRVKWMVQKIDVLGAKTIDYKYDPITGNVVEVYYQRHVAAERFIHRYTYNIVDQLVKVETSTDDNIYKEQAEYFYYETGALRRIELAEDLQGMDYIYNLAGQLKAINHPSGDPSQDPGKDGVAGSDNSNFSPDVFSMSLNYFTNDYKRTGTPTPIHSVNQGEEQYNGNIKAMTWKTNHPTGDADTQTYYYHYNKNGWLEGAGYKVPINYPCIITDLTKNSTLTENTELVATNSITLLPGFHAAAGLDFTAKIISDIDGKRAIVDYDVSGLTYDANGNLLTLHRRKNTEDGSNRMDELTYDYYPNTNQLERVQDQVDIDGVTTGANDIETQPAGNYMYNEIGQLVIDNSEHAYIYNASGLVTEVQFKNKPVVKFYYNDKNHRVRKEAFDIYGSLTHTEYYIRDVGGNTLAIYRDGNLTELPIYGASRIGVHYKLENKDRYQLTDHLGNVRAVIEEANPLPTTTTDYYPFGMPMPNRQTIGGEQYRYAFQGQEKDPKTGKEAFQLRLWDSRIGRWLTTDPYGQYNSPYLGMGNNPINGIDQDGGWWRKKTAIKRAKELGIPIEGLVWRGLFKGGWGFAKFESSTPNGPDGDVVFTYRFINSDKDMPPNFAYGFEESGLTNHAIGINLRTGNGYEIYHPKINGVVEDGTKYLFSSKQGASIHYERKNMINIETMTANPNSQYWKSSGIGSNPRTGPIHLKYFYLPNLANSMEYAKKVEGKRSGYLFKGVCTSYVIKLINKGNHWYKGPGHLGTWLPNQYPFQYDTTIQPPSE